MFCVRRIHLRYSAAQLSLNVTHKEQVTKRLLTYLKVLIGLIAYQEQLTYHGVMMVKGLRQQHYESTKPNGLTLADFSLTKPNYSMLRRGVDLKKILTHAGLLVKVQKK